MTTQAGINKMANVNLTARPNDDNEWMEPRWQCLFDIYLKEGRSHMGQKEYSKAVLSLNKALELKPADHTTLLARSHCYLEMGRRIRALRDAETVLDDDAMNPEALYAKAETLYRSGNYELSLIYFHRGLKQEPGSKLFQAGIQKSQDAVLRFGGGNSQGQRMSAAGDLSLYARRKHWIKEDWNPAYGARSDVTPPMSDRIHDRSWSIDHEDFRSQFYCPLARITKKPGLTHFRSMKTNSERCSSELSHVFGTQQAAVDENSLRQILGELYTDRKYLQDLHSSLDKKQSVSDLAEGGINFLQERGAYWDRLGPLPPPQPNRRIYPRKHGSSHTSSSSVYSIRTNNNTMSSFKSNYKKRKAANPTEPELDFHFATYKQDDELSVAMETDSHGAGGSINIFLISEPTMTSFEDSRNETKKRDLSLHIARELDTVARMYDQGRFSDCQELADRCIKEIETLEERDITDKLGTLSTFHSYLGNAAAARGHFSKAEYHHKRDLEIGDNEDMAEATSRALGNLGLVYMSQRKYNKALDVLARKVPFCSSAKEVAWVFLEIGTCFLSIGHNDYARDCGKKVLNVSLDPELELQQFQAELLVACAQEKMKHYEEAWSSYKQALVLAKQREDKMAECAISRAIDKLDRKLAFFGKKESREGTVPKTHPNDHVTSKIPLYNQAIDSGDSGITSISRTTGTDSGQFTDTVSDTSVSETVSANWPDSVHSRNKTDRHNDYRAASVMSVMQRLREESSSYATYPASDYQDTLEEVDEITHNMDLTEKHMDIPKRRDSLAKRSSFSRKKSNAMFDRRISFKLWDEGANLFECNEELSTGRSTERTNSFRKKSNREKAVKAIKQKSMQIRYQHVDQDWTPREIDTSRYAKTREKYQLDGNVVAEEIPKSGYHDFVSLESEVRNDVSVIHTSDQEAGDEHTPNVRQTESFKVVANEISESVMHAELIEGERHQNLQPESINIVANELAESILNETNELSSLVPDEILFPSYEVDTSDQALEEVDIYNPSEEALFASFLYPHEDVTFTCPFVEQFSIEGSDIMMVSSDQVSVEQINEASGATRRFSIVIAEPTKDTENSDCLPAVVETEPEQENTSLPTKPDASLGAIKEKPKTKTVKSSDSAVDGQAMYEKKISLRESSQKGYSHQNDGNRKPKKIEITKKNVDNRATEKSENTKQKVNEKNPTVPFKVPRSHLDDNTARKKVSNTLKGEKGDTHGKTVPSPASVVAPNIGQPVHPVNEESENCLNQLISEEPTVSPKQPLFKSKYHSMFSRKPAELNISTSGQASTSDSNTAEGPPVRLQPLFKSKYHETFKKKLEEIRSDRFDPRIVMNAFNRLLKKKTTAVSEQSVMADKQQPAAERRTGKELVSSPANDRGRHGQQKRDNEAKGDLTSTREDIPKRNTPRKEKIPPVLKDSPYTKSVRTPRGKATIQELVEKVKEQQQKQKKESSKMVSQRDAKHHMIDNTMKPPSVSAVYKTTITSTDTYSSGESANEKSAIKTSEIPSFIQKKKLLFKLAKKDDKIVFTPVESSGEDDNRWKVVYMRIRKGERQFTVPVVQEYSDIPENTKEKQIDVKVDNMQNTNQLQQRQKQYPIRLGSKKQFRDKMASTLVSVPEGRESKISPRTGRISKTKKPVFIPLANRSGRYNARKIDMSFLATLFEDGRSGKTKDKKRLSFSLKKTENINQPVAEDPEKNAVKLRVPRGQEVVYEKTEKNGKTVLVPVVKSAAHKVVLVKVKQRDKSFVIPVIVGTRQDEMTQNSEEPTGI